MGYSDSWMLASLACNFVLALVSVASCLHLVRRLNQVIRARGMAEQRLIQLAFELRRLEQRLGLLESREAEAIEPTTAPASTSPDSLIAVPDLSFRGQSEDEAGDELARRHGEVWALASAGQAPSEIADATGRPIGQVELIVGLYRQHQATRNVGDHARAT
jgi:hypothetical protein